MDISDRDIRRYGTNQFTKEFFGYENVKQTRIAHESAQETERKRQGLVWSEGWGKSGFHLTADKKICIGF